MLYNTDAVVIGQDKAKEQLRWALKKSVPVLLVGPAGVGKNALIREIARERGQVLIRANLNGNITVDEFNGKYIVKERGSMTWLDGVVVYAMKMGYILVLDEINMALAEILCSIHSVTDDDRSLRLIEKDNEEIKPHKDFRLVATMNPSADYVGTKELNKALFSRFVCVQMGHPSIETESEILTSRCEALGVVDAHVIAEYAACVRTAEANNDVYFTFSVRESLAWAEMLEDFSFKEAWEFAVLNKASLDDREVLVKLYNEMFTESFEDVLEEHGTFTNYALSLAQREADLEEEKTDLESKKINMIAEVIAGAAKALFQPEQLGL